MTQRPSDLMFMRPDAEAVDSVQLVVRREIRGGAAEAVHVYPTWFLIERHRQDPRWAWSTLAGMARRLGEALERFEADPRRIFSGRAA